MFNLFRLIRLNNLILIALTQYLVRFCIVAPILNVFGLHLEMSELQFALLVLSTILIAGGGYAINDYFDTKTDKINRPHKVIVGKTFSRRFAIKLHFILTTIGSLLGIMLALYVGQWRYALIFPLVGGILWFYSTTYKSQFLVGNLIVAFLVAMIPMLVLIFEIGRIIKVESSYISANAINLSPIINIVVGYSLFAFITTFIREVIKDMEDFQGDEETGRETLPIVWGLTRARIVTVVLLAVSIASVYVAFFRYLSRLPSGQLDYVSLGYITLAVAVPLLLSALTVAFSSKIKAFSRASLFLKIAMFGGVLYMLVFYGVFMNVAN